MKNRLFKGWAGLVALAMVAMVTMVSCDNEDPDPGPIVEDGLYVKGAGTALTALDAKGLLSTTRNEKDQADRSTLKEIYIAVKGGADGFSLVNVVGGEEIMWGPGEDWHAEANLDNEEPGMGLWKGSVIETETVFTVEDDGLYHVIIDTEVGKAAIARVVWGVIGASSPGGWSGSTALGAVFDLNMMDFSGTEIAMKKGDYKFRYSDGWKIYLDTTLVISETVTGITVNTNFGGAVDALVPGGDNINMDDHGFYTISMKWELDGGTTCTMTKTDNLPSTDYSAYEMGFVGDGIKVGADPHNWDSTIEKMTPAVDGSTYTWAWTGIPTNTAGSFKIRQGDDWNGLVLGFPQVIMAGTSAGDFSGNGDGNFVDAVGGTYDMTLSVDGTTDEFTLTVDPVTK